jgi:protein gp37
MTEKTEIGIADATWNPIRGCHHAGDDCRNCWAERIAGRYAEKGQTYYGIAKLVKGEPRWTGKVQLVPDKFYDPIEWKPCLVMAGSMTDLFYNKITDAWRDHVFGVIAHCSALDFMVMTKYAEGMRDYFAAPDVWQRIEANAREIYRQRYGREYKSKNHLKGPLKNTWLGVSVSDQRTADERIQFLQEIPATLRYVAVEPMLGGVSLEKYLKGRRALEWVIAGGESGEEARPLRPSWVRKLRDECTKEKRPFFFHQWGAWLPCTVDELKKHGVNPNSMAYVWPDGEMSVHLQKSDVRTMKQLGSELDGKEWKQRPPRG